MPNNLSMPITDKEIIQLLGGVTAVARMLEIKPPSVHSWLEAGIPEGRLRDLAAQIEINSGGRFSRRERWPEKFAFYWPELAQAPARPTHVDAETAQAFESPVVESVAKKTAESAPVDASDEDQAVIVAVLIAAPKVENAQQSDHRAIPMRRTDIASPYDHSDIDRRDEEVHGRRANNGDTVDVVAKGV